MLTTVDLILRFLFSPSSRTAAPLDNAGVPIRNTDLPCKGVPHGENDPNTYYVVLGNGDAYSSVSNEISVIANRLNWVCGGMNTTTVGLVLFLTVTCVTIKSFVDTTLTCGDYFGNVLVALRY